MRAAVAVLLVALAGIAILNVHFDASAVFDPLSVVMPSEAGAAPRTREVPPDERRSPEDGSSVWEWLTLAWLNPLLKAGKAHALQDDMLYGLSLEDRPGPNAVAASEEWDRMRRECAGDATQLSLWRLLWRLYGGVWCLSGLMMLCSVMFQFGPQLLLNLLLTYIETGGQGRSTSYGYALSVLILVVSIALAVTGSRSAILLFRIGARSRAALTSLIYSKSLRLSQPARVEFDDGYIVNLMQIDANRLAQNVATIHRTWTIPLKFVTCLLFLYQLIGPAALVGVVVLVVLAPGNYYAMKSMLTYTRSIQTARDRRVKLLTEVLSGMKIVKLLGWESELQAQLEASRHHELDQIKAWRYLSVGVEFLARLSPLLLKVLGFGVYCYLDKDLTASKAFTVLGLFDILVGPVTNFPKVVQVVLELRVSMERILQFLLSEEVQANQAILPSFPQPPLPLPENDKPECDQAKPEDPLMLEPSQHLPYTRLEGVQTLDPNTRNVLVMRGVACRWREGRIAKENERAKKSKALERLQADLAKLSNESVREQIELRAKIAPVEEALEQLEASIQACGDSALIPVTGPPTLHGVSLAIQQGSLNCVVGPVGCGKSTLLLAALNEVPCEAGTVALAGSVAYCSQEPFLLHATLKENILFGRPWNAPRYKLALEACALVTDIQDLSGSLGDETQIGEKGLNLSGGQKAGVSLARAVYADADVYLIDDVLAAVDVHVAETMMEQCILGALRSKTRVIVTHRAQRWYHRMDQIILMEGGDGTGTIVDVGPYQALLQRGRFGDPAHVAKPLPSPPEPPEGEEEVLLRTVSEAGQLPQEEHELSRTLSDFGPSVLHRAGGEVVGGEHKRPSGLESQLTVEEDRETGAVALSIWRLYFELLGWGYFLPMLLLLFLYVGSDTASKFWMSKWTAAVDQPGPPPHSPKWYLGIYSLFLLGYVFFLDAQHLPVGRPVHRRRGRNPPSGLVEAAPCPDAIL